METTKEIKEVKTPVDLRGITGGDDALIKRNVLDMLVMNLPYVDREVHFRALRGLITDAVTNSNSSEDLICLLEKQVNYYRFIEALKTVNVKEQDNLL